jgi:uncharacterized membrane protein
MDWFQDYSNAKNVFNGLPAYTRHEITIARYLGTDPYPLSREFYICYPRSGHPPTSILLAVPLTALDYYDAFVVWNVLSLAAFAVSLYLIVRQLRIRYSPVSLLPALTLVLLCQPLWHELSHGQLTMVLLLLLTLAWVADRNGRPWLSGALVGAAAAVKLFPAFVFAYFLLRRQWKPLVAGAASFLALTAVTAAILGVEAYRVYVGEILPWIQDFRGWWANVSVVGLWWRLFAPTNGLPPFTIEPLIESPLLAQVGSLLTLVVVLGVLAMVVPRAGTRSDRDAAFALTLTGMVLVCPVAWDHYCLLLALPVLVLWQRLPPGGARWLFLLCAAVLMSSQFFHFHYRFPPVAKLFWPDANKPDFWLVSPLRTVTIMSCLTYALVGIFLLGIAVSVRRGRKAPSPAGSEQEHARVTEVAVGPIS